MGIFDESVQLLETPWSAPVEDLYQAFKERLIQELLVSGPGLADYGILVEAVTQSPPVPRTMKSQE